MALRIAVSQHARTEGMEDSMGWPNPIDIIKKQIQGNYPNDKFRFKKFDVILELRDVTYKDLVPADLYAVAIQTSIFENKTNVEDEQTFSVSKSTSQTAEWSITEGLEIATQFEVKVPFIGSGSTTATLSLQSTQTQSKTETRQWDYSARIPVPAHTTVETTFSVLEGKINTPFTATIQARGYMWIEFNISQPGQPADWRYCDGEIAQMIALGYCVSNPKTFEASASGIFTGVEATTYKVTTKIIDAQGKVVDVKEVVFQRLTGGERPEPRSVES
jgi:hypothetical protein